MTTTTDTNFRGNDSAVLIPIDEYNSIRETEYLMSSKEMEKAILKGMDDVKNGNFKEVNVPECGRDVLTTVTVLSIRLTVTL